MSVDKRKKRIAIVIATICLYLPAVHANDELFAAADQAVIDGRLDDMLQIYEDILADDSGNVRAMLGKAAALAWQQRYAEAQTVYREAVAIVPDDVEARVGLGYAYAWDGQYENAKAEFRHALSHAPTHIGAQKGVALTHLWAGEHDAALGSLEKAASIAPQDAEVWEVTGYTHLEQQNNLRAISSFDRALDLDPQRTGVHRARLEAYRAAPVLEVFAQAASTSDADSGLRMLEVAHWPSRSTRVFARVDDSLGLDNPSIADRGAEARGYTAGVSHQFTPRLQLQLEGATRQLEAGDINSVTAKGVITTSRGALTLGAQVGRHDLGHDDTLLFGSLRYAITDRWYLEPALYASESGPNDDSEWRMMVGLEHNRSHKVSIGGYAGLGNVDAGASSFSGSTSIMGAWVRREFDGPFALTLGARKENTPGRDFSIVELGLHYRLPGNAGGGR